MFNCIIICVWSVLEIKLTETSLPWNFLFGNCFSQNRDSLFLFNSKYCNRSISVFVISKNYKPLEILPCLVLRNRRWNRFALKEALKLLYIISTNTRTFCFSIHSLFILFSYQWSIKWATTNLQSLITSKRTNFRILSNKHNVFVNCELFSRQH